MNNNKMQLGDVYSQIAHIYLEHGQTESKFSVMK